MPHEIMGLEVRPEPKQEGERGFTCERCLATSPANVDGGGELEGLQWSWIVDCDCPHLGREDRLTMDATAPLVEINGSSRAALHRR